MKKINMFVLIISLLRFTKIGNNPLCYTTVPNAKYITSNSMAIKIRGSVVGCALGDEWFEVPCHVSQFLSSPRFESNLVSVNIVSLLAKYINFPPVLRFSLPFQY